MTEKRRKPPGHEGLSEYVVVADGLDTLRDKAKPLKKQPGNLSGLNPIGPAVAEAVADLRFRRQIEHIHALGPRVTAELLAEIGAERSIMTIIDRKLDRYAGLEPETLEVTGGDGFWPAPVREIRS